MQNYPYGAKIIYKNHYESKSEAKICQRRSQDNGKIQVNKHKKHFEELT